jgi:RNA polymerase sigma factor
LTKAGNCEQEDSNRKEEIIRFLTELSSFNLSLDHLVDGSPRRWKEIEQAKRAALFIARDPAMLAELRQTRSVPAESLFRDRGVPLATSKGFPSYITAIALLLAGDYRYLRVYAQPWGEGEAVGKD